MEERLDERALCAISEPDRSELLRHAAACARCGATLGEMTRALDELLLAAPQMEPPTDFEPAVLHRITASPTARAAAGAMSSTDSSWLPRWSYWARSRSDSGWWPMAATAIEVPRLGSLVSRTVKAALREATYDVGELVWQHRLRQPRQPDSRTGLWHAWPV